MSGKKNELEDALVDLRWWQEVFGEYVTGWSYRHTATVTIPGGQIQVNARMREFFAGKGCFNDK